MDETENAADCYLTIDLEGPVHRESINFFCMLSSIGLLPIKRVKLTNPGTGKTMETCALQYNGSTVIQIYKSQKNVEISLKKTANEGRLELFVQ